MDAAQSRAALRFDRTATVPPDNWMRRRFGWTIGGLRTNRLKIVQVGSVNRHAASTKRDFVALEQRRMQAARLLETGLTQVEVALRSGVSRQSVSRWAKVLDESGARGLRFVRAGRKPRLDRRQLDALDRLLRRGLARRGIGWANEEVADVIRKKFGIALGRTRISELLHDLGFAPQRRQWRPLVDGADQSCRG